jgi:hypothetical protein
VQLPLFVGVSKIMLIKSNCVFAKSVSASVARPLTTPTTVVAFGLPCGMPLSRQRGQFESQTVPNSRFRVAIPTRVELPAGFKAMPTMARHLPVNPAEGADSAGNLWSYHLPRPTLYGFMSPPDGHPDAVWAGTDIWVDPEDLKHKTIPEMQEAMYVRPEMLKHLEHAFSYHGLGMECVRAGVPINDIVSNLSYATTEGVLALCDVKEAHDKTMNHLEAAYNPVDTTEPNLQDTSPRSLAQTSALLDACYTAPVAPASPREVAAASTAIQKAIDQGQTLAQIVANKAHQCTTPADVRAVHKTMKALGAL